MFLQTLKGMLSCERLGQISLVSELDIQMLDHFNDTEKVYDNSKTIVDLFREQAQTGALFLSNPEPTKEVPPLQSKAAHLHPPS